MSIINSLSTPSFSSFSPLSTSSFPSPSPTPSPVYLLLLLLITFILLASLITLFTYCHVAEGSFTAVSEEDLEALVEKGWRRSFVTESRIVHFKARERGYGTLARPEELGS